MQWWGVLVLLASRLWSQFTGEAAATAKLSGLEVGKLARLWLRENISLVHQRSAAHSLI